MPGEGRKELERHLDRLAGEKRAKEQAAKAFKCAVACAFSRIKPKLEEALGLLEGRGQGASVDRVGDLTLVLNVAIDGQQSRLIFEGDEATGKIKVSCHLSGMVGEELAACPPDEVTPAVAEAHLDYFCRGLASGCPMIQAWQRFRALPWWRKGDRAARLKMSLPRVAISAVTAIGSILFVLFIRSWQRFWASSLWGKGDGASHLKELLLRLTASAGAAAVSALILWFIDSSDFLGASGALKAEIAEIFFSVFGLVYAIIVGLFIIEAHRRMRELSTIVQSELNAVGDLEDFLQYFRKEKQQAAVTKVRVQLVDYAKWLIADLEQPKKAPKEQAEDRRGQIANIIRAVKGLETHATGTAGQSALDAIVRKIADLTTFRSQKTEMARRGFPPLFYALLAVMTLVVIVGFCLLDVSGTLHYVLIFVTAAALAWLFMLIRDVDHPLEGYWNIREELSNVAETIGRP